MNYYIWTKTMVAILKSLTIVPFLTNFIKCLTKWLHAWIPVIYYTFSLNCQILNNLIGSWLGVTTCSFDLPNSDSRIKKLLCRNQQKRNSIFRKSMLYYYSKHIILNWFILLLLVILVHKTDQFNAISKW